MGLGGSVGAFPAFTIRRVLQANLHDDQRIDDVARRAGGESQVRTAAAADTCSGLDALLLQGCGSSGGTGTARTNAGKSPATTGTCRSPLGRRRHRRSESIPAAAQAATPREDSAAAPVRSNAGQRHPMPPGSPATLGILPHSRRAAPLLQSLFAGASGRDAPSSCRSSGGEAAGPEIRAASACTDRTHRGSMPAEDWRYRRRLPQT